MCTRSWWLPIQIKFSKKNIEYFEIVNDVVSLKNEELGLT